MSNLIYYNGQFKEKGEVYIDPEDRGYLFADGVYEVIVAEEGRLFKLEEHFARLERSALGLDILLDDYKGLQEAAVKLLEGSGYPKAKLYIQVTRGTETRNHAYSDGLQPNVLMMVSRLAGNPAEYFQKGVKAITIPDERWSRCHIKAISLLPNVLAKTRAKREGAFEAIQIRDGFVTDGSSSNIFLVEDEIVITPPATNYILNGITRVVVLELAAKLGYLTREESISPDRLFAADQVFLTGTTTEVMPVCAIDGKKIGSGQPGRITMKLYNAYRELLTRQ